VPHGASRILYRTKVLYQGTASGPQEAQYGRGFYRLRKKAALRKERTKKHPSAAKAALNLMGFIWHD
jgi:hypothetical protein